MKERILAYKKCIIAAVVIVVVLAVAFCFGGDLPETAAETAGLDNAVQQVAVAAEAQISAQQEAEAALAAAEAEAEAKAKAEAEAAGSSGMKIDPATGKDKYNTSPVPQGKPAPVEPEDTTVTSVTHTCTISISCAMLLNNMDSLDENKVELVPADGWILKATKVSFNEGESVFDVLQRATKAAGIQMEAAFTPMYNSAYIEGINNIYEFDCGELSGWMYSVNGWYPNYGSSRYQLKAGDVIEWKYTCDLGKDIGGSNFNS
ncbi:MAG: DUF4430 domain-containing protein [Bacillota bacterium]|jgi:hypothetical protein